MVLDEPLQIAVLVGGRALRECDLRLIGAISGDRCFRLRSVLKMSSGTPAGGRVGGLAGMLLAAETRLRRGRGDASPAACAEALAGLDLIEVEPGACAAGPLANGLDLILDLDGREEAPAALARAARFGVWSLHYGDSRLRSPVPGFWEVYRGQGVTGTSLLKLGRRACEAEVIASGLYPTRTTYPGNIEAVRHRAVELVLRELGKLHRKREITPVFSKAPDPETLPAPNLIQVARYGLRPVRTLSRQVRKRAAARLGMPVERWSLFVGSGRYDRTPWADCVETRAPPGQYWADPFLFRRPGGCETHVFFELFDEALQRGRIAVGRLVDRRIVYLGDAIAPDYHLSYPFVFTHGGDVWMMPESHRSRRLELWRCSDYPLKWTLEKTVLEGESLVDSTLCHWDGHWWLFTNKAVLDTADHNCALHVYRIDSPMMNALEPHRGNPVVVDATRARNGGRIHVRDDALMRPAQNNAHHYGYGLGVHRITDLTLDSYEEKPVFSVEPTFLTGISSCHHLDTDGETFVFDAQRDFG